MAISKKVRQQVYEKHGGHCAYCGREIEYKDMQVDHIKPKYFRGSDEVENLNPACRMCNFRKGTFNIEQFRKEIERQADGVCRTFQGKMSLAYGLLKRENKKVIFYFERIKE